MSRAARVLAQAKVNLALRILARETDGFHSLETLFHQLELADEVTFRRTEAEKVLACSGPALPAEGLGPARANLAWRAAEAYASAAGWSGGFVIEIVKQIPAGGGLGGGSSDAGAVLRACERLADRPLGPERLERIAAALGSDVPFLAGESPAALGLGRGERLQRMMALPVREVALLFPRFGVPTANAYSWLAASRGGYSPRTPVLSAADLASWEAVEAVAGNDFEPVVGARHPDIPALVAALRRAGAAVAMMSGSGSTVFGIFDAAGAASARAVLRDLPGAPRIVWTRTAQRVVPVELSG